MVTGYAYGVFLVYDTSGASNYFDKIEPDQVQPGDWCFWNMGSSCPLSHVALLLEDNGDGTGEFLSQTQGEGTTITTIRLDIMGGFRLKE